jgi:mRNA interferase RelE/StbE
MWSLQFLPEALKELKKLDRSVAARIIETLERRIAVLEDPRTRGKPLKAGHEGYWRWRIGEYRVIGLVEDGRLAIIIIRVAHRSRAYRQTRVALR